MFESPHRLHSAAIIIGISRQLVATFKALLVPGGAILLANRHSRAERIEYFAAFMAAILGLLALIGPVIEYFTTSFWIDGEALVIRSGLLFHSRRTIPLARIQNVNVERTVWHRLLHAASVKVETASGHHGEGKLTALSLEDANALQAILLQRRQPGVPEPVSVNPEPLYQLSLGQVLLAGALENRVLYVFGAVVGTLQLDRSRALFEPVYRYLQHLSPAMALLIVCLTTLGLIVVGWVISIVISATRFYGFRIERHERGLLLAHGLITQFRSIVPLGRIQAVRVVEPPLFRLLGYAQLYADTAGSFNKRDEISGNQICPLVPNRGVGAIGRLLLPNFEYERLAWNRVSPWTIWRRSVSGLVASTILLALAYRFISWHEFWLAVPLAVWCLVAAYLHYRIVGYAFTADLVAARSGLLRRHATLAPFDRLQHYTIHTTPFQRRVGVASVSAVTAATGHHAIHISDVDARAAAGIRETLRTSIRSHLGSRRGGL